MKMNMYVENIMAMNMILMIQSKRVFPLLVMLYTPCPPEVFKLHYIKLTLILTTSKTCDDSISQ